MSLNVLRGVSASKGIVIAKAFVQKDLTDSPDSGSRDVVLEQEISRFLNAIERSLEDLERIHDKTKKELGEEKAQIFEAHMLILEDPEFMNAVKEKIGSESVSAEAALAQVSDEYVNLFESMDNEYMKERAADIRDIQKRLKAHLLGVSLQEYSELKEPVIIVAHDLSPSDTAQLDKNYVKGFATNAGGTTSHTAILARAMEIPAVVGLVNVTENVKTGDIVIVDGLDGEVIINPSDEDIIRYEEKRKDYLEEQAILKKFTNSTTETVDGRKVEIAANIGTPDDLPKALQNGAEGVGLFRSEFLYLNRNNLPDEDEQFLAYKKVVEAMDGKPVIIRTLDIGGDKELSYLNLPKELNPFLGYRAIRYCLDQQEVFKTQLRAILRASNYGNVKIMYPMISTVTEVRQANELLNEVKEELLHKEIPFDHEVEVGIMMETPASAVTADILIKEVDFFSIGTNDLIQYTMAADRMNDKVSYLYQPYHPAILRLIKMVIDAAHQEGKWVGMCGEMAGDITAVPILLGLGLDEFSMNASSILPVRQLISKINYEKMNKLALEALMLESQDKIAKFIKKELET